MYPRYYMYIHKHMITCVYILYMYIKVEPCGPPKKIWFDLLDI